MILIEPKDRPTTENDQKIDQFVWDIQEKDTNI